VSSHVFHSLYVVNKIIVYIDELNISINTGHSVYCAIFIFYIDKDILSKEIVSIEDKLNIKYLHWVDLSWKSRVNFTEKINNLNFTCRFLIYKNPINQESILEDFISEIVNVDNKSEALIRLTDFMAGLIRSYADNKNQHNEYMVSILKDKINS
jgi:hypothetical protein